MEGSRSARKNAIMRNMKKKSTIVSGRTRFGDIVAEFWLSKKPTGKVAILCDGAPGLRSKAELGEFLAHKGYSVFQIRYRGTWESEGEFLRHSPADDVDLAILAIQKGFKELWTGTTYYLDVREVVVLGASFGGAAAILATQNPLVTKAIAIAPVVDWSVETKEEPFSEFMRQIAEGFGGAYRCPKKNFKKLLTKKFYNPVDWTDVLDGNKLFLLHAKDDTCVPYVPTKKLAKKIGATYVERARGGHLGSSIVMEPAIWRRMSLFLKTA
jgi:pimeloyl-ACP methyl ester carboxylesterase